MSYKYSVGDASAVLWENLKTLKTWTPVFVKARKKGKLSPAQIEAYSVLLNQTSGLRLVIVNALDTLEAHKEVEKTTGKPWHVFVAEMQAAFDDIGTALQGTGNLGEPITLIVIGVIIIVALLAGATAFYSIALSDQAAAKAKMAELANSTALAAIDCKKSGKCSEKDVQSIMAPFKEAFKGQPSTTSDIKDILLYLGVAAVVIGGVFYVAPLVNKLIISRKVATATA